jgi:signal transduction histidine kinase
MKNGAEAMTEGGVLQINTRALEDSCILEVVDTGCGIPPSKIDHIFEAFYTTKSRGTGLGLAFAKRVVEEHDGHIEAKSEIGTGTTFRIALPKRLRAPRMDEVIESLEMVKPMLDPSDPLASREDLTRQPRSEVDGSTMV